MDLPPAVKPAPAGERFACTALTSKSSRWRIRRCRGSWGTVDPSASTALGRSRRGSSASSCIGLPGSRIEQDVVIQTPHGPMPMSIASRPYPSGGALYELEFYAAIEACDGLDRGLYYYEPCGHGLIRIAAGRLSSGGCSKMPRTLRGYLKTRYRCSWS